jgi:predicted NAD/FAD-binding protein
MHRDITHVRSSAPVAALRRLRQGVELVGPGFQQTFDAVVLACHSDEALAVLGDEATDDERAVLAAVRYQPNRALLHSDPMLLPRRRKVWSAWNYLAGSGAATDRHGEAPVAVSYLINMLQPLPFKRPVVVTLNPYREPDPALTWREIHYSHPVFDNAAVAAQGRLPALQGHDRVWFAGAWTGYGFHEDGLRSAVKVAGDFGVTPPWSDAAVVSARHGA